jgi:hypothetical protein
VADLHAKAVRMMLIKTLAIDPISDESRTTESLYVHTLTHLPYATWTLTLSDVVVLVAKASSQLN